jgi:hypothetical protein
MIDMIRESKVPSHLMQSAARGSLSLPPEETIEVLVYLALHHKLFGPQARLTLAGWDEKASLAAASDPKTSAEVLGYFVSLENLRTCLLPALLENLSVNDESVCGLAVSGPRWVVENMLKSARITNSPRLLQALQTNPNLRPNELGEIAGKLSVLETRRAGDREEDEAGVPADEIESTVTKYLEENAEELVAEKDKPFQPIGMMYEESSAETPVEAEPQVAVEASTDAEKAKVEVARLATAAAGKTAAALAAIQARNRISGQPTKRDSTLQKIGKLDIKGRIALAMRGSKEERSILVRDGTKLVALAVLESPKVSDGEVEGFAQQKNVLESVLRAIPMKRRFAKNYNITRNLVFNPRTPLDLSLTLMKNMLIHDLKNLSGNKEISETIRKVALRMFKQKVEKKG